MASALMLLGIGLFGALTAIATNTLFASSRSTAGADLVGQLERLAALRSASQLSSAEFEIAKARLLG